MTCLDQYRAALDGMLASVDIPVQLLDDGVPDYISHSMIDEYYNAVLLSIVNSSLATVPIRRRGSVCDEYVVPGWNELVSDKHRYARDAFLRWVTAGKPRHGPELLRMQQTRAAFKLAYRYCQQHDVQVRADVSANRLLHKDFKGFWDSIRKFNNNKATVYANAVNGVSGEKNITNMWKEYYEQLYNTSNNSDAQKLFQSNLSYYKDSSPDCVISLSDVLVACEKQKKGKAAGLDGIQMEAFIFGSKRLMVHVCLLFNLFVKYCYMPHNFMSSVIVPLVKCKTADLSDVNNYRAIVVSNAFSKLFESVIADQFKVDADGDEYQFGFKAKHSTGICTNVLKRTVEYYTSRGSHVFCSFIDFSKAFDKVNYWKLFSKLLGDGINSKLVQLLAFWYSNQQLCVRWHNTYSGKFTVGNGTKQGGVLSPYLFTRYIRDLLNTISNMRIGCNIGGLFINVLAYADDLVLMAPSWSAMQQMLNALYTQVSLLDMSCNIHKTVCMNFKPANRSRLVSDVFPLFKIGSCDIQFVSEFKYLGHVLDNRMNDDGDIYREIKNLFIRTNVLLRRFGKCSVSVKLLLFKSYCLCMYDTALWYSHTKASLNKLRSCYNRCVKLFFGFGRSYSLTQTYLELRLPTFDTVLVNNSFRFEQCWRRSPNILVRHLDNIL